MDNMWGIVSAEEAESLYAVVLIFMQVHQLSFALQSGAELSLSLSLSERPNWHIETGLT